MFKSKKPYFAVLLAVSLPVLCFANSTEQEQMKLLEQLDRLDALDQQEFDEIIADAELCISEDKFDCAKEKLLEAKDYADDADDYKRMLLTQAKLDDGQDEHLFEKYLTESESCIEAQNFSCARINLSKAEELAYDEHATKALQSIQSYYEEMHDRYQFDKNIDLANSCIESHDFRCANNILIAARQYAKDESDQEILSLTEKMMDQTRVFVKKEKQRKSEARRQKKLAAERLKDAENRAKAERIKAIQQEEERNKAKFRQDMVGIFQNINRDIAQVGRDHRAAINEIQTQNQERRDFNNSIKEQKIQQQIAEQNRKEESRKRNAEFQRSLREQQADLERAKAQAKKERDRANKELQEKRRKEKEKREAAKQKSKQERLLANENRRKDTQKIKRSSQYEQPDKPINWDDNPVTACSRTCESVTLKKLEDAHDAAVAACKKGCTQANIYSSSFNGSKLNCIRAKNKVSEDCANRVPGRYSAYCVVAVGQWESSMGCNPNEDGMTGSF